MKQIIQMRLLTYANSENFIYEVSKAVREYQSAGADVEIQYSYTENFFSALVIARL